MKKVIKLLIISFIFIMFFAVPVSADTGKTTELAKYALSWDGHKEIPYVWGGGRGASSLEELSEKNKGTDCSGFTSLVYRHFGINITMQSSAQKNEAVRTFTEEEDAIPGDITWWEGHVGIYIGDGKIVHTNTSKPPTNYPHVSDFGNGEYRKPTLYLRMVDDVEKLKPINDKDFEDEVKETDGYGDMITESDINGLEIEEFLLEYQKQVTTADRGQLSEAEQNSLVDIGESKKNSTGSETRVIDWFHAAQMFFGMVCILYGILLILAYFLDYNNVFIEVSLLSIITFGKFKIVDSSAIGNDTRFKGFNKRKNVTYVTFGMVMFRVAFLELVGVFLISGLFQVLLLNALDFVRGVIK